MTKLIKKVWGTETELVNCEKYCLKYLDIDIGGCSSLHYHKIKDEAFTVYHGSCIIELGPYGEGLDLPRTLIPGDTIRLKPFTVHRFWIPADWSMKCRLIEVSSHHDDADVYRLADSKRL